MAASADYLKGKSVICVSHVILGADEESLYLLSRAKRALVIRHPLIKAKDYGRSLASEGLLYETGELKRSFRLSAVSGPELFLWIKDAAATLLFAYRCCGRFDIFLGTDAFTARLGITLRRLGKVSRVIYAPTDYIPDRFSNQVLNNLYHRVERACCYRADCVWDVSRATMDRRAGAGVDIARCAPAYVVPNGNHFNVVRRKPTSEINRWLAAYVGALNSSKGVELIIDAMPEVLKRVPQAELVIIGGGSAEAGLRKMAADSAAADRIKFTGAIFDQEKIEEILTGAAIGLAPYLPEADGYIKFGDPLKVKQYLACGLPVIMTDGPEVSAEITARGAGTVIEYSAAELAEAMIVLMLNEQRHSDFREKAIEMGADYDFSAVFDRAFIDSADILCGRIET